jgi:hypothetical protein
MPKAPNPPRSGTPLDPVEQEERLIARDALAQLILGDPRTQDLFKRWDRAAGVRERACKVRDAVERLVTLSSDHAAPAWQVFQAIDPARIDATANRAARPKAERAARRAAEALRQRSARLDERYPPPRGPGNSCLACLRVLSPRREARRPERPHLGSAPWRDCNISPHHQGRGSRGSAPA